MSTKKIGLGLLLVVALSFSALMGGMMGPGFIGSDQTGRGPFGPGMMRGHGWMWGLGMGRTNSRLARRSMHRVMSASSFAAALGLRSVG